MGSFAAGDSGGCPRGHNQIRHLRTRRPSPEPSRPARPPRSSVCIARSPGRTSKSSPRPVLVIGHAAQPGRRPSRQSLCAGERPPRIQLPPRRYEAFRPCSSAWPPSSTGLRRARREVGRECGREAPRACRATGPRAIVPRPRTPSPPICATGLRSADRRQRRPHPGRRVGNCCYLEVAGDHPAVVCSLCSGMLGGLVGVDPPGASPHGLDHVRRPGLRARVRAAGLIGRPPYQPGRACSPQAPGPRSGPD